MRWKVKTYPAVGDNRQRLKFAWLPITIDKTIVWLESYICNEHFANDRVSGNRWLILSVEVIKHDGMW